MLDKFNDIVTNNAFRELSETELKEYIGDKNLNVANEDPVFDAVVSWVKHDMENRKDKFENLLEHVTLSHCSLTFLRDVVMQEPLMERGKCFQWVAAALISQASSQSLQLGTPRRVQHSNNSLVTIYDDQCWLLMDGESEWKHKTAVRDKMLTDSHACNTGDGILITGGLIDETVDTINKCYSLSLPTQDKTIVSDLNVARRSHFAVCVGGLAYVLGGINEDDGLLQSVEYLDRKTGSWHATADMPIGLFCHAAVSYQHYIYLFAVSGQVETFRESFVFDTVSKIWGRIPDKPQACADGCSVVYRDRIYVLGSYEKCCMSYNPAQEQWQTHTPPRVDHSAGSAVVWRDRILLCGGYDTTVVEEYNPDTDTWSDWKHSLPERGRCTVFAVHL